MVGPHLLNFNHQVVITMYTPLGRSNRTGISGKITHHNTLMSNQLLKAEVKKIEEVVWSSDRRISKGVGISVAKREAVVSFISSQ